MVSSADALAPVRRFAGGGAALSDAEIRALRHHVAATGYEPSATKRMSADMLGQAWSGGIIQRRDRIPAAERDFIKHARAGEWPTGTSLADFVQSLQAAIIDETGGIFLDRSERGSLELTFISSLESVQGPAGSGWVMVGFDVDYGWWTTAFQPVDGPRYVVDRSTSGVGRWIKAP